MRYNTGQRFLSYMFLPWKCEADQAASKFNLQLECQLLKMACKCMKNYCPGQKSRLPNEPNWKTKTIKIVKSDFKIRENDYKNIKWHLLHSTRRFLLPNHPNYSKFYNYASFQVFDFLMVIFISKRFSLLSNSVVICAILRIFMRKLRNSGLQLVEKFDFKNIFDERTKNCAHIFRGFFRTVCSFVTSVASLPRLRSEPPSRRCTPSRRCALCNRCTLWRILSTICVI
jgi:hypothetical protein